MIITSSDVNNTSTRSYSQRELSYKRYDKSVTMLTASESAPTFLQLIGDKSENSSSNSPQELYERNVSSIRSSLRNNSLDKVCKIRNEAFMYLLRMLFGDRTANLYNGSTNEINEAHASDFAESSYTGSSSTLGIATTTFTNYYEYSEYEETSFQTTGSVVTADGRTIDFNVNLTLSRAFTQATESIISYTQPVVIDPLVINYEGPSTSIGDMSFYFDLDADGNLDEVNSLGFGSGFLAYDENENGIIDDGSELFGVKSQNGFSDLARYDLDNNGWIDEADTIFEKLKVWYKDENGNDVLLSLKDVGIGAISLSSAEGDFSLTDSCNQTEAIIRRSGIFLYENGGIGTIQQLDLAT